VGRPIADNLNFLLKLNFLQKQRNKFKICSCVADKIEYRVVMNSSIGSTLRLRALDVGSLNYFEAMEILIVIKI